MLPNTYRPGGRTLGKEGSARERFVRELYTQEHSETTLPLSTMEDRLLGEYRAHKLIHGGRSPFVLVTMPQRSEDQEAWLRVLAEVKERVKHVIFIEISTASEVNTLPGLRGRRLAHGAP